MSLAPGPSAADSMNCVAGGDELRFLVELADRGLLRPFAGLGCTLGESPQASPFAE
jgi:hypothetical protein